MKFPTAIWRIADRSCKRVLWLIDERNSGETTRFDFGTPVAFPVACQQGPACAIVDARAGGATLWTGSQKPHFARDGVAQMLGLPPDKVHGIWVPGPGSYGRNDAGDAGIDAALLSKAVGRPV